MDGKKISMMGLESCGGNIARCSPALSVHFLDDVNLGVYIYLEAR